MDPISLALDIVSKVLELADEANTNQDDCQLLAKLAGQTEPFLKNLESRSLDDPLLVRALESLTSALEEARTAIDQCCKASFFVNMVCAGKHNHMLKQAATSLAHALDQMPMAALGMTTDIHDCLFTLKDDLKQSQFRQTAESMQQTKQLKDEMERAFNDSRKGTEEVKKMIQDMLQASSSGTEQRKQDMEELQSYLADAKRNKETLEAFQLQQMMDVIAESVRQDTAPQGPSKDVIDIACCPISGDVMNDPVILKDSCVTYDRHSIEKWMAQGHRIDPVTKAEIVTGELISNVAIRGLARMISGKETEIANGGKEERHTPKLLPGIYEGFGSFSKEDGSTDHKFAVMVLEPDDNVQGYLIPQSSGDEQPEQETRILFGKWNPENNNLFFADAALSSQGTVVIAEASQQITFSLSGDARFSVNPTETAAQVDFRHLSSPPLLYNYLILPGLLEIEGVIEAVDGRRLHNKLVLVLDGDNSLRGWMSAKRDDGKSLRAHALRGTWESTGLLSFSLYFPHPELFMESAQTPVEYLACYKLEGDVGEVEYAGGTIGPSFSGTVKRMPNADDTIPEDGGPLGISINLPGSFSYNCFRIPGRRPPHFIRRDLNLLRLPNETDLLVKPGIVTISAYLPPGENGKDHFLSVHHDYEDDVRNERQSYCIWHTDPTRATHWTIQTGHRLDDYYISVHSHPDGKDAALGQDLTVHERDILERKRNVAFQYMITSSRDESNTWNLDRRGSGYVAVVHKHAYERSGFTEGYVLATPLAGANRRDDESHYARISSLPAKAIKIQINDQHPDVSSHPLNGFPITQSETES